MLGYRGIPDGKARASAGQQQGEGGGGGLHLLQVAGRCSGLGTKIRCTAVAILLAQHFQRYHTRITTKRMPVRIYLVPYQAGTVSATVPINSVVHKYREGYSIIAAREAILLAYEPHTSTWS